MLVSGKPQEKYRFWQRWLFRSQKKKLGQVLYPSLAWGRLPFAHFLFILFWRHLDRPHSHLDPVLRALVQVRVAQLTHCAFCIDFNALNVLRRSGDMERVEALSEWSSSSLFSPNERLALHWAEELTKTPVQPPADLAAQMKESFSDDALVELSALISFQNMSARFNAGLGLPSQGLCQLPGQK